MTRERILVLGLAGVAALLLLYPYFSNPASAQVTRLVAPVPFVMPAPDFDSGWQALSPGQMLPVMHNLGGDPDLYLVDFQQRTSTGEMHNMYNGRERTAVDAQLGAYFENLTPTAVDLWRLPHGPTHGSPPYSEELRIRIWVTN